MSFLRRTTIPFVALGLLAACADTPRPTEVAAPQRPAFDFTNNMDNGNLHILRDDNGRFAYFVEDAGAGLVAIIAVNDREDGCHRRTYLSPADVQDIVANPSDPQNAAIHELVLGTDMFITVYRASSFAEIADCADLASRKIAQGLGNSRNTDSDLFTFLYPHHNWDAFGIAAQGDLDLLAGGTTHFIGVNRCAWNGSDFATLRCTSKVNLT